MLYKFNFEDREDAIYKLKKIIDVQKDWKKFPYEFDASDEQLSKSDLESNQIRVYGFKW